MGWHLDRFPAVACGCQEMCGVVCSICRLEKVRRTFQHQEVGLGENEDVDNGGSCSCCALLSFLQLVCPPGCVQSWSVTPCGFENVIQCTKATSPPASDDYSFWEHRCGIQRVGTGSVSGWVGVCGRQVGCEGKSDVKVTVASTARNSASLLSIPFIPSWLRGTPSSTGPCGLGRYGRGRNGCG